MREPVVAVVHGSAWKLDEGVVELVPRTYVEAVISLTEATLA